MPACVGNFVTIAQKCFDIGQIPSIMVDMRNQYMSNMQMRRPSEGRVKLLHRLMH